MLHFGLARECVIMLLYFDSLYFVWPVRLYASGARDNPWAFSAGVLLFPVFLF